MKPPSSNSQDQPNVGAGALNSCAHSQSCLLAMPSGRDHGESSERLFAPAGKRFSLTDSDFLSKTCNSNANVCLSYDTMCQFSKKVGPDSQSSEGQDVASVTNEAGKVVDEEIPELAEIAVSSDEEVD